MDSAVHFFSTNPLDNDLSIWFLFLSCSKGILSCIHFLVLFSTQSFEGKLSLLPNIICNFLFCLSADGISENQESDKAHEN